MGRLPLVFLGLSLYFLGSIILEKGYSLTREEGQLAPLIIGRKLARKLNHGHTMSFSPPI